MSKKSLKGPKRKLTLDKIDGITYMKKSQLDRYYFKDGWNIKDFQYHFGVNHRIVRRSLYKYYSKEEVDKVHREKIAKKQKGDNNSNKVNWYKPSKLIPLMDIQNAISKVNNVAELRDYLNITPYELSSLMQFYNLKLPNGNTLLDDPSVHSLTKSEIKLLYKLCTTFEWYKDFFGDSKKLCLAIEQINNLSWEIRELSRRLKRIYRNRLRDNRITFPSNLIEFKIKKALEKLGYKVKAQIFIPELNIHCDFLLNNNTILEVDGKYHNLTEDLERDKALSKLGYKVLRFNLQEQNLMRYVTIKKLKQCLKKFLLKV